LPWMAILNDANLVNNWKRPSPSSRQSLPGWRSV